MNQSTTERLDWDGLLEWQRDNKYIISGYRKPSYSWHRSLSSMFWMHNETINIYSHLLGTFLSALSPLYLYAAASKPLRSHEVLAIGSFILGTALCFLFSAIYHTLSNHSLSVARFWNQLDYLGIFLSIWGTSISLIYFEFYSDYNVQLAYYIVISILTGGSAVSIFYPAFQTSAFRAYRVALYSSLCITPVICLTHGNIVQGWRSEKPRVSYDWLMIMVFFLVVGIIHYVYRVPEKWCPGVFDIYGHSHQIMHFAVVLAVNAHLMGISRRFRQLHECKPGSCEGKTMSHT